MIEERRGGPPYMILLAVVVVLLIGIPMFLSDGGAGEALTELISELLSPLGLLLLPIILILVIQFLSSNSGSFVSTMFSGEPNSVHRATGSPVGVAFVLLLVLFLLYSKFSIFGGDEDSDD